MAEVRPLLLDDPSSFIGENSHLHIYGSHEIWVYVTAEKFGGAFYLCNVACKKCGCMVEYKESGLIGQEKTALTLPAMAEFIRIFPSSCKEAENFVEVFRIMSE
jgi:hypothetical protein